MIDSKVSGRNLDDIAPRDVVEACRSIASDAQISRLVEWLNIEGSLDQYVSGDAFLKLLELHVRGEWRADAEPRAEHFD